VAKNVLLSDYSVKMGYIPYTDKELAHLLTKNDEKAFRELYIRYRDKLWHFSYAFLKSEDDASDIVQEIFMRIWELRSFIDPERSLSSFIYTMARNRILNFFRDMDVEIQVKQSLSKKSPIETETAESSLIFSEYQQILADAIEQLPPKRKRIFNMSRVDQLSHKEIAVQLNISVNTVQEHISESLHFIKKYFLRHTDITLSTLLFIVFISLFNF
jgi:RNA polymerase sigma-70 factor (ECF subfamily)